MIYALPLVYREWKNGYSLFRFDHLIVIAIVCLVAVRKKGLAKRDEGSMAYRGRRSCATGCLSRIDTSLSASSLDTPLPRAPLSAVLATARILALCLAVRPL